MLTVYSLLSANVLILADSTDKYIQGGLSKILVISHIQNYNAFIMVLDQSTGTLYKIL